MLPEHHEVLDSDDIVLVVPVMVVEILEDSQLHTSLILELLLIANDFDSDTLVGLVIKTLDSLTKAALAQELEYFVSIT